MYGPATVLACLLAASATPAVAQPAPLRLREALSEALRASPSLSAPRDSVENARIQGKLAESRFGLKISPNVNTGTAPAGLAARTLGVDVSKKLPFGTDVTTSVNSYSYGIGVGREALHDLGYTVGVSQPLLGGAGLAASNDRNNARRALVTSERAMDDARQRLIVTVADRYFTVLRQQRLVFTSERAVERAKTFSISSQARATVGLATQLDVLRGDLLQSQAELTLSSQREALASAIEDLNLILGRGASSPIDIGDADLSDEALVAAGFSLPPSGDDAVERYVREALASRPDVRESRDRIDDARRAVSVSKWNLLPQVNLNASYTERGIGGSSSQVFAQAFNGWRVGLSTNYALDRSDQVAAAGSASISLRAAQQSATDTERHVEAEVRRSFRGWTRTRDTIAIQRKSVELAEKQLRLAQLRYERGLASSFDVVDAENNLYQTQSALIGAEVDRAMAALALERAAGTLNPERFLEGEGQRPQGRSGTPRSPDQP